MPHNRVIIPCETNTDGMNLPSVESLLVSGGDARTALNDQHVNRYGCPPCPDDGLLSFGSSTASVISRQAFSAVSRLHRHLMGQMTDPARLYTREMDRIRRELIALCSLESLPGVAIVFAASGTDLHLIAAQALAPPVEPLLILMVTAGETGRGVPAALAGRHFSQQTATGLEVQEGATVEGAAGHEVIEIAVRNMDGTPRTAEAIDAEAQAIASQAIQSGRQILVVIVDQSKTGLIAPSPAWAAQLARQWPDQVSVLVDACQFRLQPQTLAHYLQAGFLVAVTGSKFLTGPTFSGALFLPPETAASLRQRSHLPALVSYCRRGDWPDDFALAQTLADTPNWGLLLRWEAALTEFRAFQAVPVDITRAFLLAFQNAMLQRLADDPCFEPIAVPAIDRQFAGSSGGWDMLKTIFPFLLIHPESRQRLPAAATEHIYRLMMTDQSHLDPQIGQWRCQLGQPVVCGQINGGSVSALRVNASARLVLLAHQAGSQAVIQSAMTVLDKVSLLTRNLNRLA